MEVGGPTVAVFGIVSGDGYKNRAVLRDKVVLASWVCLKLMVSSNKPAVFASVTDLVDGMKAKFWIQRLYGNNVVTHARVQCTLLSAFW